MPSGQEEKESREIRPIPSISQLASANRAPKRVMPPLNVGSATKVSLRQISLASITHG